jgi:replicative DNA helicase Mcm
MSNSKGVRFSGTDDEWNEYASIIKKEGGSIDSVITSMVRQKLTLAEHTEEETTKTKSRHENDLTDKLVQTDLSNILITGTYHVELDDLIFIQTAKHELSSRIHSAVHNAIYNYWVNLWATKRVERMSEYELQERISMIAGDVDKSKSTIVKQEVTKMNISDRLTPFFKIICDKVKVTFTCNLPTITLSDLREKDLGRVIQFDCVIIGPTPKKLDLETGKYIQKVLIQEPESSSKNNQPVMIPAILHGDDTNNIATGQTKRFIGIYATKEPENGQKVESEKALIIDTISVQDLEEKAEIILTPQEIAVAKEFAETEPKEYLDKLINSFCPKIYGRELEKKALYLSLLGGSDFVGYRRESHIMLIGEPDTGKSELVKFANSITHKSSIVDGSNATGVGILFALDDYDGMKILRQGAMILNNNGHMIVDEYDKMPKQEQKKLNQAMEQQRATYNKGGHMGNAECKTAIIASCNPENDRWNEDKTIIDNLPFDASTVSRFDLLIRLKHDTMENQIRAKMLHITKSKRGEIDQHADPLWIKGLLNYLRTLRPTFTPKAEELLINKYVEFTMIEQVDGALPVQTRQMEGIQRLCEAYAKLFFKSEIDEDIVNEVIVFYQECLATLGMKVEKGITQMDLRGMRVNKDEYFEDCFNTLSKENEEGHVFMHELASELSKNEKLFYTDDSILRYIEARKTKGWLYEPKVGVLKKQ